MAVNYNLNPLGGFDVQGALQGLGDQFSEQRKQEAAMQEREQMQGLILKARQGDTEALDQVYSMNPNIGKGMDNHFSKIAKEQGIVQAEAIMNKNLDAATKWQAATPEEKDALKQVFLDSEDVDFGEDEGAMSNEQIDLATNLLLHSKYGKGFSSGGGEKSLPAEAVAFNDLIKDFTPEQQKTAKLVKAGLKGRAMSNAELSAIESGDIKNYADWKSKMKEQQKFAEMTGSSRAKKIDKGFETITKIDAGVRNIDRAIAAIEGGAGVGVVEKMWPSIKAASVELDNIRSSMALDVVGATTFGALSAGELALAKDVALPTGLDSSELLVFLNDRKAAQQKLRDYYNEQIQFLDQGGTVAGFLRSKESGQQAEQPQEQNQLSDQDLLSKYGG